MKSIFAALAGCFVTSILAACAAPAPVTTASAAVALANVHLQAAKQCGVIQSFLASMTVINQSNPTALADLNAASNAIGKVCTAIAEVPASGVHVTFSIADVQTLVNTGVPALLNVVAASTLSADQKTSAELAITAAQLALSSALAQYAAPTAVTPAISTLAA